MKHGFDTIETYARMNYLIDVIRGNVPPRFRFSELTKEYRQMYTEEAKVAEYIITEEDMNQLEHAVLKGVYA